MFKNVTFKEGAHVSKLYGNASNAGITFDNCVFEGVEGNPIVLKANGPKREITPGIKVINSTALDSEGFDIRKSEGYVLENNTTKR